MGKQYTVLEFNNQTIRIVVGKQYKTHALIQQSYVFSLPQNARIQQDNYDPAVLGPFLKDLFRQLSLTSKHVIISTIDCSLLSRVRLFRKTRVDDLDDSVNSYISEHFPKGVNGYISDYTLLASDENGPLVRINIMKQALIQGLYSSLREAGLKPVAYIARPCSLERVLCNAETLNLTTHEINRPYGVMDFQKKLVSMSFFQNGHLIFSTSIAADVDSEDEGFLNSLSVSFLRYCRFLGQRDRRFKRPERFFLSGTVRDPLKARELLEDRLTMPVDVIRSLGSIQYAEPRAAAIQEDLSVAGCLISAHPKPDGRRSHCDFFYHLTASVYKRRRRQLLVTVSLLIFLFTLLFR